MESIGHVIAKNQFRGCSSLMLRISSGGLVVSVLCSILWLSVLCDSITHQSNDERVYATEVLRTLSETIQDGFATRHAAASNCSCSYHACSNQLDQILSCTTHLRPLEICGSECGNRKVSFSTSVVSTPPNVDLNNLSPLIVEEACIYQGLNQVFVEFKEGTFYTWIYFGTAGGVFISYPGAPFQKGVHDGPSDENLGHCEHYDPRLRPWYVDATSAPKDLIILVDASGSMTRPVAPGKTRWDIAKQVAKTAIDLLHFSDAVRLVILGDYEFSDISNPILIGSGEYNKERLKTALDSAEPHGRKRAIEGMESAFYTFRRAQANEISSTGCQRVILWISDGHLCDNHEKECDKNPEFLGNFLEKLEKEQETLEATTNQGKASIFVATVGNHVDTKLARYVACANNGTWMHIKDKVDIVEQMLPYFSFLAGQMKENDEQIVWSRFYEDFGGLGTMTTGTRRIFALHGSGTKRGKLLGVAGYDMPLSRLRENGLSYAEVLGQLALNIGQCNVHGIDMCQLQLLRERDGECPSIHPQSQCYQDGQTGMVYYLPKAPDQRETFDSAMATCDALGGRLGEIRHRDHQSFLSSLAKLEGSWIGLKKQSGTRSWSWLSGIEREVETYEDFWTERMKTDRDSAFCAAIDSRGTRLNIGARDCREGLHLICEFDSPEEAERACKGDIYLVEPHSENPMPSLTHCLADVENLDTVLDRDSFISRRKIENSEDVFCSMGLDSNATADNAQRQCCESCLSTYHRPSTTESTSDNNDASGVTRLCPSSFLLALISLFLILIVLVF